MRYRKSIIFAFMLMVLVLSPAGGAQETTKKPATAAEELSREQFWKEFLTALQANDAEQVQQLITDNPTTAGQVQQWLTELGKGTGETAEQFRALAEVVGRFRSYNPVLERLQEEGRQAYYTANYQIALEKWQAGLQQARVLNNRQYISQFLTGIGLVYWSLGQYQQALESYEQALVIHREFGDRRGEGSALGNIGVVYGNLGQHERALECYEQALVIHRELGDRLGEGADLGNIGLVYSDLGQYQRAVEFYEQALAIKCEIGDRRGEGDTLSNLGVVYWSLGQYQRALEFYEQALVIKREIGDRRGEGNNLTNIGLVYSDLGQYQRALEYYEQALVIHREIGDRHGEGMVLNNLGVVYDDLGQSQRALEFSEQALAIAREIGDRHGEGMVLNNLGIVYWSLGQYERAFTAFQESLGINETLGALESLWRAQRGVASVEVRLDQPESAIVHYEQALDTIEALRAGLTEKAQKLSFMQDKLYVYDDLIDLLQDLHQTHPDKGYDRKALEIFERKQGRVFLEEMGKSGARLFAGLPESISQRERDLETQLEQTRTQLVDERAKPITEQKKAQINTLEERKKTLEAEQGALQEQIKTDYPDYYALKYPTPVALEELQQTVLQPGELLLVYGVMKDKTCLWLIGQDEFGLYTLDSGEDALAHQVAALREALHGDWGTERGLVFDGQAGKKSEEPGKHPSFAQLSYELYTLLFPEAVRPALTSPPAPLLQGEGERHSPSFRRVHYTRFRLKRWSPHPLTLTLTLSQRERELTPLSSQERGWG